MSPPTAPNLAAVRQLADTIDAHIVRTPVLRAPALDGGGEVYAKLEFLQATGTFKARGALSALLSLSPAARNAGVTAVSAGNHAIAVAWAARVVGTSAKVVMTRSANAWRVERCRHFGADIVFADDVHGAFQTVERIRADEGRHFVHPFEGPEIVLGTATLGLEIVQQVQDVEAVIVPIGGGGLCAGVASAVKQANPHCRVYGVEPEGADSMRRSFESGKPTSIERVGTIADSLGAPFAMPYTYSLCRRYVDRLVTVDDRALVRAMGVLFRELHVAVEPACAASTAALAGPLADELRNCRTVLILCGSNIDWATYASCAALDGHAD